MRCQGGPEVDCQGLAVLGERRWLCRIEHERALSGAGFASDQEILAALQSDGQIRPNLGSVQSQVPDRDAIRPVLSLPLAESVDRDVLGASTRWRCGGLWDR